MNSSLGMLVFITFSMDFFSHFLSKIFTRHSIFSTAEKSYLKYDTVGQKFCETFTPSKLIISLSPAPALAFLSEKIKKVKRFLSE